MGYLGGLLARDYNNDDRQQNVNANNRPSGGLEMTLGDVLWTIFIIFLVLFFYEDV